MAVDVEHTDGFDLVIEQLNAKRQRCAHGEQINEAAAHTVFTRRDHLGHVGITRERKLIAQLAEIELPVFLEEEGMARQKRWRCDANHCRGCGGNKHITLAIGYGMQGGEPLRSQVLMRRKVVVGQGFPVREQMYAQLGREPGDFFLKPLGIKRAGRDDCQQSIRLGKLRNC